MSTNLELHLYMFLRYCHDSDDYGMSKNFKDEFSDAYYVIYEGNYCHDRIKEIFHVK